MCTDLFSYFIDSSYSEYRWIEINRKYKGFEINQRKTGKYKILKRNNSNKTKRIASDIRRLFLKFRGT